MPIDPMSWIYWRQCMVLGVVKPSIVDPADIKGVVGAKFVQAHCGHFMWLLSLLWFISQHMTSSRRMIWFSYQMTWKVAPSKALLLQSRNIRGVITWLMMDSLLPSSLKHQAFCLRMAP
ncbi:hypothetical protein H5410_018792, partial [Solanum commersonii]